MPYRRGYVPPFPDFSKTGMSYSEETEKKDVYIYIFFKKPHILSSRRGIEHPKTKGRPLKSYKLVPHLPGKSWWLSG